MSEPDWEDRFAEMALREVLAGERPPSVKARVLARIRAGDPTRADATDATGTAENAEDALEEAPRPGWTNRSAGRRSAARGRSLRRSLGRARVAVGFALAAAALLLVAGLRAWGPGGIPLEGGPGIANPGSMAKGGVYPAPRLLGGLATIHDAAGRAVAGGEALTRGARLRTEATGALLNLGGYASVAMAPESELTITGAAEAEAIHLDAGAVECEVVGGEERTFVVRTAQGEAAVLGTRFTVEIQESKETGVTIKRMVVTVLAGVVLTTALQGEQALVKAGETQVIAEDREEEAEAEEAEGKKAKTPEQKEFAAARMLREEVRSELAAIRERVLKSEAVATARRAAMGATAAYAKALAEHADYQEAERLVTETHAEVRGAWRRLREMPREEIREAMRDMREAMQGKREEIEQAVATRAEILRTDPTLTQLRAARQAALAKLYDTLQAALDTDEAYQAAMAQSEALQALWNERNQESVNAWGGRGRRRDQDGGGDHGDRRGRRERGDRGDHGDRDEGEGPAEGRPTF